MCRSKITLGHILVMNHLTITVVEIQYMEFLQDGFLCRPFCVQCGALLFHPFCNQEADFKSSSEHKRKYTQLNTGVTAMPSGKGSVLGNAQQVEAGQTRSRKPSLSHSKCHVDTFAAAFKVARVSGQRIQSCVNCRTELESKASCLRQPLPGQRVWT